jgi:AcrR family transcriptional regulator
MDEIADRAGVSKPVLYQHFPGKLDLYCALLDQTSDELVELVRRALASTTDNKLRVAASIQEYFDFIDSHGAGYRLIFESDLTNETAVRDRVDKVSQDCGGAIAGVIREDTGLPDAEAHLLGMALSGMAQVSARFWVGQGSAIPREEAARLVAALSWRGLGGFPKTGKDGETAPGEGSPAAAG